MILKKLTILAFGIICPSCEKATLSIIRFDPNRDCCVKCGYEKVR